MESANGIDPTRWNGSTGIAWHVTHTVTHTVIGTGSFISKLLSGWSLVRSLPFNEWLSDKSAGHTADHKQCVEQSNEKPEKVLLFTPEFLAIYKRHSDFW